MINKHTLLGIILGCTTIAFAQSNSNTMSKFSLFDLENTGKADIDDGKVLDVEQMEAEDYLPEIHGTLRGRYEYCSTFDASRFQVRNARVSFTGNVHPLVAYKAEIDLSDAGVTKMLDAYIRVFPVKGMALTVGQMKVPFSTDNLRSPHVQIFSNRSFIAKEISGLRDVGFTAGYTLTETFPFSLVAGIYNGEGIYQQKEWHRTMCFATRATFDPSKYINISLNFQSFEPDSIRMNAYDIGLFSNFFGFRAEVEYLYKTYNGNLFKPAHAFTGFLTYELPLKKVFSKISFMGRYDMMTDNNRGFKNSLGQYVTDDFARQRVTGGVALTISKPILAELRINYEKYFYEDWSLADLSEQDKLVIELVARF